MLEKWEILGFFFQFHTTTAAFFLEKKVSLILVKIGSDEVQSKYLRIFGTFATIFAKVEKNSISSFGAKFKT